MTLRWCSRFYGHRRRRQAAVASPKYFMLSRQIAKQTPSDELVAVLENLAYS